MATVQPQTLANIGTGPYLWGSTLTYHSQTSTHYLYTIDNDLQYSIKVGKSGETDYNVWSDNGSSTPGTVTDGAAVVYLRNGSQLKYAFAKPTTADWISSGTGGGSGGGTLSTNVAVGSFYDVSSTHFSYKVEHTSAFSTSQTYQLHSTTLTPTFISDLVVGAPALSTNSRTHNWTIPDVVEIRDAYGTVLASLTLGKKKVFCNFW